MALCSVLQAAGVRAQPQGLQGIQMYAGYIIYGQLLVGGMTIYARHQAEGIFPPLLFQTPWHFRCAAVLFEELSIHVFFFCCAWIIMLHYIINALYFCNTQLLHLQLVFLRGLCLCLYNALPSGVQVVCILSTVSMFSLTRCYFTEYFTCYCCVSYPSSVRCQLQRYHFDAPDSRTAYDDFALVRMPVQSYDMGQEVVQVSQPFAMLHTLRCRFGWLTYLLLCCFENTYHIPSAGNDYSCATSTLQALCGAIFLAAVQARAEVLAILRPYGPPNILVLYTGEGFTFQAAVLVSQVPVMEWAHVVTPGLFRCAAVL